MMRDYEALRVQDKADADRMARANSSFLHHCMQTIQCADPTVCVLCSNAARLAVQHYRPIIEKRMIEDLTRRYDARRGGPYLSMDE